METSSLVGSFRHLGPRGTPIVALDWRGNREGSAIVNRDLQGPPRRAIRLCLLASRGEGL